MFGQIKKKYPFRVNDGVKLYPPLLSFIKIIPKIQTPSQTVNESMIPFNFNMFRSLPF